LKCLGIVSELLSEPRFRKLTPALQSLMETLVKCFVFGSSFKTECPIGDYIFSVTALLGGWVKKKFKNPHCNRSVILSQGPVIFCDILYTWVIYASVVFL